MPVESTQLVDEVMRQWPETIRVFLDYKMRCVGCPIACFHTVDDACHEHGVNGVQFLASLRDVVARAASGTEAAYASGHQPAGP